MKVEKKFLNLSTCSSKKLIFILVFIAIKKKICIEINYKDQNEQKISNSKENFMTVKNKSQSNVQPIPHDNIINNVKIERSGSTGVRNINKPKRPKRSDIEEIMYLR